MITKTRLVVLWATACFLFAVCFTLGMGVAFYALREVVHADRDAPLLEEIVVEPLVPVIPSHVPLPEEVRAIYWTGTTAGSKQGAELLAYMQETGLNAVVIDTKMDDGELSFLPNDQELVPFAMDRPAIQDLEALLTSLREAGIYRIARIPVMRDSAHASVHPERALHNADSALWHDATGAAWMDPASPEVAAYALALAREAYARGFDEVQFDYVRFATDGAIHAIHYPAYDQTTPKEEVMQAFFETVGGTLQKEGIPVSFDLFGMTYETSEDFNIGQRLVDVYPYADFISPMVYPSHYADGFQGFSNPAEHPYEVVVHSLDLGAGFIEATYGVSSFEARRKTRPWLQDFDIGAVYTASLIEAEIKAARDAGASGWILWNARNVYEPAEYVE